MSTAGSAGEPGSGPARVDVFFYGDYVCPFSYVADARLRRLRDSEPDLGIHWRPLSIHPAVPSDGLPVEQLGYDPGEWKRVAREIREQAGEVGIPVQVPDFVANSHEALQAAEFAKDVGREAFRAAHRALFRAYMVEGRNLGRRDVLLSVCEDAGLDREALEGALDDDRYADELRRVEREAERYDIEGTPTLLFGRHKLVGAAPLDVMRDAAERARGEGEGAPGAPDGGGAD